MEQNLKSMSLNEIYRLVTRRDTPHYEWVLKPDDKKQKYINKKLKKMGMYGQSDNAGDRAEKALQRIQVKLVKKERERNAIHYQNLGIKI